MIDDEEWGMTEFAQLVAETLDQSLGPHSDFHERAQGVGDAAQVPQKRRAASYIAMKNTNQKKKSCRPVAP